MKITKETINKYTQDIIITKSLNSVNYKIIKKSKLIKLIKEKKHEIYEILYDKPCKLYLDIEYYTDKVDDSTLDNILDRFNKYVKSKCIVYCATRPEDDKIKNSFRVIYPEEKFENAVKVGEYVRPFRDMIFKEGIITDKKVLDTSVYRKGISKIRLPYCLKYGKKDTIFVKHNDVKSKYSESIITYTKNIKEMTKLKSDVFKMTKPKLKRKKKIKVKTEEKKVKPLSNDQISKLLELLPAEYYDDRDKWIKVLFALGSRLKELEDDELYNDLANIAIDFSKKSAKFKSAIEVMKLMTNIKDNGITLGSLCHWAQNADSRAYNEIMGQKIITDYSKFFFMDFLKKWNHKKYTDKSIKLFIEDMKNVMVMTPSGNSICILKKEEGYDFCSLKNLQALLNNYYLIKQTKEKGKDKLLKISFKSIFIEYINDLSYANIINRPNYNDKTGKVYNMYRGFKAEPIEEIDNKLIKPILDHLKFVWMNNNETNYKYIINWLAHIIQFPQTKTGVCVCLLSEQGAGKNIIGNFLINEVFGNHLAATVNDIERVTGRFNNILCNKIFTVLDECKSIDGDFRTYNKTWDIMKSLISEKHQHIERKGLDVIEVEDYNNYMVFSNNMNCVKIERSDRRYAIFELNNEYCNNRQYFRNLSKALTVEAAKHFIKYLMNIDLNGFDIRDMPNTKTKQDQKINSLSNILKFYVAKYRSLDGNYVNPTDLYDTYKKWCDKMGYNNKSTRNALTNELKKILGCGSIKKKINRKVVRVYNIVNFKKSLEAYLKIDDLKEIDI